jgi:hypothetical protein
VPDDAVQANPAAAAAAVEAAPSPPATSPTVTPSTMMSSLTPQGSSGQQRRIQLPGRQIMPESRLTRLSTYLCRRHGRRRGAEGGGRREGETEGCMADGRRRAANSTGMRHEILVRSQTSTWIKHQPGSSNRAWRSPSLWTRMRRCCGDDSAVSLITA